VLASAYLFDFVPRSGRALVYPVYKGMYERHVPFSRTGNDWRDMVIMWSKDLGRTLDYLEARDDIDHEKVSYYGFSLGALYGPVFTAVDGRFRASVLLAGGLRGEASPEIAATSFAPRSRVPTLMLSGQDDFLLPAESSQRPLFRLLGAPEADKRHARLEGGHIPSDRREIIREVLDWLDRHLGPVGSRESSHTPSPMGFLAGLPGRLRHERPYLVIPMGYAAPDALVPDIHREPLEGDPRVAAARGYWAFSAR
jgi:eukaryotic-like serine/threonine-protein kinase